MFLHKIIDTLIPVSITALRPVLLMVAFVVFAFAATTNAQDPRGYRGDWNSWGYDAMTLELDVWRITRQKTSDKNRFKIANDDWQYEWSQGGNVELGVITGAFVDEENSSISASNGFYYTFAMNNVNYGQNGDMIVQETENPPVNISSVSHVVNDEIVTVSITTSSTPSAGEKIYVRYTLDNWNSSTFVQATGSGTAWSAIIEHSEGEIGQTVAYYVLSTTVATPTDQHANLQTIRWNNNNGNDYSYQVESSEPPEAPTTQATAIQFSHLKSSSVTVSWNNGNGANRLVVAREGAPVNVNPVNGETYSANNQFGSGDQIDAGIHVVYSGSGSSVHVSGLAGDTTYHFRVYEFNGGGASSVFNVTTASGNPGSVITDMTPPYQLYINEVMSSNSQAFQDEDGDYPDWVELYNAGPDAVNLQGWGLSDNYGNPFKWVFGNVTIQPSEFLIVWASNKNRTNAPHIHTSWAISGAGEEVILTHPDGMRIDELAPIAIPTDISIGRQPDGTGDWLFFENPTPGAANTTSGTPGFLSLPAFSVEGGLYNASVTLDITTTTEGADIRYTTDGAEPTESSPIFSGPISLNSRAGTANVISEIPTNDLEPYGDYREGWLPPDGEVFKIHTIRARLFKDGYLPSPAVTHSYLIDAQGVTRYSLPIISIATDASGLFDHQQGIYVKGADNNFLKSGRDWERPGSIEFFEADGVLAFRQDIGVRLHGGTTRNRPRKTLRIYARGPSSFRYQLFPDKELDRFDTFILRSSGNDWGESVVRDLYMQSLATDTELDRQYGRPALVFINGEYWGLHNIRERFDDGYIENNYGLDAHEFVQFESTWEDVPGDVAGLPHYDRGNPDYASAYMDLHNYIRDQGVETSGNYEYVQDRMDVDNFIDFYQAHIFFGNSDWPGNNIRVWRSVETNRVEGAPYRHDARLRFMLFDTDFGFGLNFHYVPGRDEGPSHNTLAFAAAPVGTADANQEHHTVMFRRLLVNNDFRRSFITRFSDQLNTWYSRAHVTNKWEQILDVVNPEMDEHVARWRQPYDWNNERNRIRSYGEQRTDAVWGHIQSHFNLGSRHDITVNVNDAEQGHVRVNSIDIHPDTAGVYGYPWTGSYFSDYEVTLTAVPQPGYQFVEWIATETSETIVAADNADNYGSWNDNSTGGSGFGNWDLQTTSGNSGQNGHFLFSGSPNFWGLYANSGQEANAFRDLSTALVVDQTFSTRIRHDSIVSGATVGVALQNSSGQSLWDFFFTGGGDHYQLNGNSTGISFSNADIYIDVTLTGSSSYSATITVGGTPYTFSGSLQSQGNQSISRFRAWNYNAGAEQNLYVQQLTVTSSSAGSPSSYGTDETITISLEGASEFQAVFEEVASEESVLVHYWNFNDTMNLLTPSYSLVAGAGIGVDPGPITVVTSGTGQDFWGENARFGDEVGAHLRVNDPIGATMDLALPTTGFKDIVVMYETRRSGSGAGTQHISYTLNGLTYDPFTSLTITEVPTLHSFDLTAIPSANDNPNFGLRITFAQGTGGTVGNNRFDNMTLEGVALPGVNQPPVVDQIITFRELVQGAAAITFNLNDVFSDPEDDPMTFGAASSDTNAVSVSVSGATLTVSPMQRGEATVTVTADDGNNPPVSSSFRVLVYPDAYVLESGNFLFGEWAPDTPEKTYPEHMLFLQSDQADTALNTPLLYAYHIPHDDYHVGDLGTVGFPYNNTGRTRINGLGENGISFINTGRGRDLGGALLALDTRNVPNAPVGWLAGTVLANTRVYAIRLQYRVGATGEFVNVLDAFNQPVEYVRVSDGHSQPMDPVELPAEALGQEYVQLLWRYYRLSELDDLGARAQLRLDNIVVANSSSLPATTLVYGDEPPAFWQSGRLLPGLTVHAVDGNGLLDTDYEGSVSLALIGEGSLSGTTMVPASAGVATFTNLTVTGVGTNRIQATSGTLADAWSEVLSFSDVTGVLVPRFIQGEQNVFADNNDRIPYAFRAQIDGLLPNATYRYGNRVIVPADPWDQNGAGNMIFVTGSGTNWIRNTDAPDFADVNFGVRHYEFTSDANGSYAGWFITEPSGNARFTPGNTVRMRILLNDGQNGTNEQHYLTLAEEVTVIRFGSNVNEATGILGQTVQDPKHFVYLYDNTAGTNRPLAGVPIEITGSVVDDRYAAFYEQVVAGTPHYWGTLIPNTLPTGVRRIEARAIGDASILAADTDVGGIEGTINPSGGLDAILLGADVGIPVFLPGGDGTWDLNASWSTGIYPDGVDSVAVINKPLTADRDVELFTPVTIGNLIVNNADSTNMNRIRTRNLSNTLTFESSSGPAELTINGSGSGFVEFRTEEAIVLAGDLLITITNVHENHGKEGFFEDDYGALRLRDDWTGPGGLIKDGPGVMTLTGDGKRYAGATVVDFGVLRVTAPATPTNTSGVAVNPGGQLRLVSSSDELVPIRVYGFGGDLTLNSMGRGGDVPGQEMGMLGALRYDPGSNNNRAEVTNAVVIAGPTSLHVDGSRNVLDLGGSLSGLATFSKSGGGTLVLSGDSSAYTVPVIVSNGTLQVDGVLGSSVSVDGDGTVSGHGFVGALSGSGTVSPGPGTETLTAPSVNGLNYRLTFTETGASILRLTGGTPFLSALNAANTIELFFDVETLNENSAFEGGIFTDQAADFFGSIENATWSLYVRDATGSVEHEGETYSIYTESIEISTVAASVDFGEGPVNGRMLRIGAEEEPIGFAAWQNDEFSAAELNDPAISGPLADPDGSGIPNLLRYALGLGRHESFEGALPNGTLMAGDSVFRYRRLLDENRGVSYMIEVSDDLVHATWRPVVFDADLVLIGATPTGDEITETVSYRVPKGTLLDPKYFRLEVILLD